MSDLAAAAVGRIPVCVFAKPPVAGHVKTRLGLAIGQAQAALLARAFFQDTWATVRALPWARPILASTTSDTSAFGLDGEVELWLQGEGDLGERLERVLGRGLEEARFAIVLGSDIPGLPSGHLEAARATLASREVALGPTEDGGFYLIGASRLPAGALADIPWSSDDTRMRTQARLASVGLSLGRAPSWFDVDVPDDLSRIDRLLGADPSAAPHTHRALAALTRAA